MIILKKNIQMKNKIVSLALIVLTAYHSSAQDMTSNINKQFGIKMGANYSSIRTSNTIAENPIVDINSGLTLQFPILAKLAFQTELCYIGAGSKLTFNDDKIKGSVKYRLSYLQVPFNVVYKINRFVKVHTGPYAGVLIAASIKNGASGNEFDFEKNIQYADFEKIDLGWNAGFSLHYKIVAIGFRYNVGLTDVASAKTIDANSFNFASGSNRVASVYLSLTP
jgi:hypothetical protein